MINKELDREIKKMIFIDWINNWGSLVCGIILIIIVITIYYIYPPSILFFLPFSFIYQLWYMWDKRRSKK